MHAGGNAFGSAPWSKAFLSLVAFGLGVFGGLSGRREARWVDWDLSGAVFGALVGAEGAIGGMAEDAVAGPAREADFADNLGFDPRRRLGGLGRDVERAGVH